MQIHSVVVLKKSGLPVYYKNFSDQLEKVDFTLFSSFLSAILQFSQSVVKRDLNILEIGTLRFFIRKCQHEFKFVVITDRKASALLIEDRIKMMCRSFFNVVDVEQCVDMDQCVEDNSVDETFQKIVQMKAGQDESFIIPVKKLFEKEITQGEISSGALLTTQGSILYSSLPNDVLHTALKELEIRMKAQIYDDENMPKLIYQLGKKMIFAQMIKGDQTGSLFFVILYFDGGTTLGMADFALEDIIKGLCEYI